MALAIGAAFRLVRNHKPVIHSLAVVPFRNLGTGTADDYLASGMTDALTTDLAKLGVSKVISETSVAQFKDTKKSVPEIAGTLGVDAIVEGAVLREGDQVRITVQLIRGDTDRHVWANSYQRQMTNILALQDEVALGVAHAIKLELSPGTAGQPSSPKPVNSEAYEAYLKGRFFMQKADDSFFRTGDYFQQSIQLDPGYAPAYAMGRAAEAMTEAQRAEDLDPLSISAHDTAALAALCGGQPDRTIAEGGKILELVPDDPRAYLNLSAGHLQKGMYQEALQEIEKGLLLTHRDPTFLAVAVGVHGRLGQMEQAATLVEEMRAESRMTSVAPYFFAIAFAGMGQQKQAIDALEKAYKTHDAYMVALRSDPLLSPLHSNPRFQDLVKQMNFPLVASPEQQ